MVSLPIWYFNLSCKTEWNRNKNGAQDDDLQSFSQPYKGVLQTSHECFTNHTRLVWHLFTPKHRLLHARKRHFALQNTPFHHKDGAHCNLQYTLSDNYEYNENYRNPVPEYSPKILTQFSEGYQKAERKQNGHNTNFLSKEFTPFQNLQLFAKQVAAMFVPPVI